MKEQQIINAYEIAKERYAKLGIDTDAVMETLQSVPMSMHCWQADDVTGIQSQGFTDRRYSGHRKLSGKGS